MQLFAGGLSPASAYGYQFEDGGTNNNLIYRYISSNNTDKIPRAYVYYQNYQMKSLPITDIDINEDGNIPFKQGGLTFNCSALAISGIANVNKRLFSNT